MSEPLPTGKIYLVRGSSSNFWWLLKDYPAVEILWKPSPETLANAICYLNALSETTFAVVPQDYSIESYPQPDPDCRVFVMLASYDSDLSPAAEKLYKTSCPWFYSLDVRNINIASDEQLGPKLKAIEQSAATSLVQDLGRNPWRLNWQLEQQVVTDYEVDEVAKEEIKQMILRLGTPASLTEWTQLPKATMHALMYLPEIERCGLYRYLTGGERGWGMCPPLWSYYDMLLAGWQNQFWPAPEKLIKLFVTWVYLSSTVWATSTGRGFYLYRSRKNGQHYAAFEPSDIAIEKFYSLLLA